MNYANEGLNEPFIWLLKEQSKTMINKNKSKPIRLNTRKLIFVADLLLASIQYLFLASKGFISSVPNHLKRLTTTTLGLFADGSKTLIYFLGFTIGAISYFSLELWVATQHGYYDAMKRSKELEDRLSGARFNNE